MTEIVLPIGPSLNGMFKNARRGRVKTEDYRAWILEAGYRLNASGVRPVASPVSLTMRFGKLNIASDLSNRIKCLEDLLVSHKIIVDDSVQHVHSVSVERAFDSVLPGYVEITITHLPRPLA